MFNILPPFKFADESTSKSKKLLPKSEWQLSETIPNDENLLFYMKINKSPEVVKQTPKLRVEDFLPLDPPNTKYIQNIYSEVNPSPIGILER